MSGSVTSGGCTLVVAHRWFSKHFKPKNSCDIGVSAVTQSRSPKSTFIGGNTKLHLIFLGSVFATPSKKKKERELGDTQIIINPETIRNLVFGRIKSTYERQPKELDIHLIAVQFCRFFPCGEELWKPTYYSNTPLTYRITNILPIYIRIPVPIIKYPRIGSCGAPIMTSASLSPTMVHQPNTIRIAGTEYANIFIAGIIIFIPPYSHSYLKNGVSEPPHNCFSKQRIIESENLKIEGWHSLNKDFVISPISSSPHDYYTWNLMKKQNVSSTSHIIGASPRYTGQTIFSNQLIKFASCLTVMFFVYIMMTVFFIFLQQIYDKKSFFDSKMEIVSLKELDLLLTNFGTVSLPLPQFVSRCWEDIIYNSPRHTSQHSTLFGGI